MLKKVVSYNYFWCIPLNPIKNVSSNINVMNNQSFGYQTDKSNKKFVDIYNNYPSNFLNKLNTSEEQQYKKKLNPINIVKL